MAGGIRHEDDLGLDEAHEINVTPFIDVMLVLLIIFMVAAPLATVDTQIDLPGSTAEPQQRPDKPLWLSVGADRALVVNDTAVAADGLKAALDRATGGNHDTRLFLRADKALSYGDLTGVLNQLRAAGYLKIALVGLETPAGTFTGTAP